MVHPTSISDNPTLGTHSLLDLTGQLMKPEPHSSAYTNIYKAQLVATDSVNVNLLSCSLCFPLQLNPLSYLGSGQGLQTLQRIYGPGQTHCMILSPPSCYSLPYIFACNQRREIRIRLELFHENITPLLGISYDFGRPSMPCLVCPYFRNGDIISYLRERPNFDKLSLVSCAIINLKFQDLWLLFLRLKESRRACRTYTACLWSTATCRV